MASSSSTSVGWDTSIVDGQSAWSTPVEPATSGASLSSAVDETRTVPVDANDYSRFKNIGADDDEDDSNLTKKTLAVVGPAPENCRNCHKPGAKLKCSVCKKATYCARSCQASDWTFHKRICKKPEPVKKPEPPRKRPVTTSDSTASSASSSSASTATTTTTTTTTSFASSTTNKTSSSSSKEVVVDESDLSASEMRGYKNGLPYFHRELSENEQKLIGDIAPKKVEVAPEVVKPVVHEGSAWNAAGTFEERAFTKWAEAKWTELFCGATFAECEYTATLLAPEKITGDASVCVVRGKKRYLFDFNFKLPFEIQLNGNKYKGSYHMNEISNDDTEIEVTLTKKPSETTQASALRKFVGSRTSGLQKEVLRIVGEFSRQFQEQ